MATITGFINFPKSNQIPSEAILDLNGKQTYLGNSFVASVAGITISNTNEDPIIVLANPATSTKSVFINYFRICSTTQSTLIKYYVQPTITVMGSNAVTPVNLRPAHTNVASAVYHYSPTTVTSNGTLIGNLGVENSSLSADSSVLIVLDPGYTLLITNTSAVQGTVLSADLYWYEL